MCKSIKPSLNSELSIGFKEKKVVDDKSLKSAKLASFIISNSSFKEGGVTFEKDLPFTSPGIFSCLLLVIWAFWSKTSKIKLNHN